MSEWWTYRLSDFLMFSPAVYARMVEPGITPVDLERLNGHLFLVSCQTPTSFVVTVTAWEPGETNTKAALADCIRKALDDLGLTGTVA